MANRTHCPLCAIPAAAHRGLTCAEAEAARRYASIANARLRALMLREVGVVEQKVVGEDEGRAS